MSTSSTTSRASVDPRKDTSKRFQIVAGLVFLLFGGLAIYDAGDFKAKYLKRCADDPNRPECAYLKVTKPNRRPDLGIVMDQGSGKWAIQLRYADEKTSNVYSARLQAAGANPRLIKIVGRKRAVSYYIQLGRFKTRKDALDVGAQLKTKGLLQDFAISEYRSASK